MSKKPLEPIDIIDPVTRSTSQKVFGFFKGFKYLFDRSVPLSQKLLPIATIIYIISPIDISPDVIPFLGQIDDLALLVITFNIFVRWVEKNRPTRL